MVKADSHRILRNTGALYVRMLLVMAVSLYISRVVLAALGVDDYGIYNVVGGIVVFFSFLTGALSLSIQRFLAADLGRSDLQAARRTFSVSLQVHAVLAVVLLLAAETLGVWFLTTQLNIPAGRMPGGSFSSRSSRSWPSSSSSPSMRRSSPTSVCLSMPT